jgi:hypothetical protein
MFFDNFLNNIQSQGSAFASGFCGKKRVKYSRQNLLPNSLAANI